MNFPKYKELSVKQLKEEAMNDKHVRVYLPDPEQITGNSTINREFFLGILCTINHEKMMENLNSSFNERYKAGEEKNKGQTILISEEW